MPDLDDFYAFKMTSGGSSSGPSSGNAVFWVVVIIIGILWLIGEIFGA